MEVWPNGGHTWDQGDYTVGSSPYNAWGFSIVNSNGEVTIGTCRSTIRHSKVWESLVLLSKGLIFFNIAIFQPPSYVNFTLPVLTCYVTLQWHALFPWWPLKSFKPTVGGRFLHLSLWIGNLSIFLLVELSCQSKVEESCTHEVVLDILCHVSGQISLRDLTLAVSLGNLFLIRWNYTLRIC